MADKAEEMINRESVEAYFDQASEDILARLEQESDAIDTDFIDTDYVKEQLDEIGNTIMTDLFNGKNEVSVAALKSDMQEKLNNLKVADDMGYTNPTISLPDDVVSNASEEHDEPAKSPVSSIADTFVNGIQTMAALAAASKEQSEVGPEQNQPEAPAASPEAVLNREQAEQLAQNIGNRVLENIDLPDAFKAQAKSAMNESIQEGLNGAFGDGDSITVADAQKVLYEKAKDSPVPIDSEWVKINGEDLKKVGVDTEKAAAWEKSGQAADVKSDVDGNAPDPDKEAKFDIYELLGSMGTLGTVLSVAFAAISGNFDKIGEIIGFTQDEAKPDITPYDKDKSGKIEVAEVNELTGEDLDLNQDGTVQKDEVTKAQEAVKASLGDDYSEQLAGTIAGLAGVVEKGSADAGHEVSSQTAGAKPKAVEEPVR